MTEHDVLNVIDGVRYTRVLRNGLVRKVDASGGIYGNILKQRIAANCLVDVRLRIRVEVDDLRIAAALVVEHALIVPAVLVVSDEEPRIVGRERGLARTGEAEEQRCVLPLLIRIGRAVHGGNPLQREIVVHHREHALFHLAAVPRVDDDLLAAREVEHDRRLGMESEFGKVRDACLCSIVNDEVGLEVLKFLCGRTNEHIRDKMRLPGHFHNEADGHARVFVRAAERIHNKEAFVAEFADRNLTNGIPCLLCSTVIIVLVLVGGPPHGITRGLIIDDEFILRRTARVDARHNIDRIVHLRHLAALISLEVGAQFLTEQLVIVRIVNNFCRACNTVLCQINHCHGIYLFLQKDWRN